MESKERYFDLNWVVEKYFVDINDAGSYRVAKIIKIHTEELTFCYLGGKAVQRIPRVDSKIIAPFRFHTVWNIESKELYEKEDLTHLEIKEKRDLVKRVRKFLSDKSSLELNAFEITQKIRGELFLFIYSLFNSSNSLKEAFVKSFYNLIVAWIFTFSSYDWNTIEEDPYLYLKDLKRSLAMSYLELTQMLSLTLFSKVVNLVKHELRIWILMEKK